jgi:hypothetical protein
MTTCTCDTHTSTTTAIALTCNNTGGGQALKVTGTGGSPLDVVYVGSNSTATYGIFSEGGINSILGKTYVDNGKGVSGQVSCTIGGYGVYGECSTSAGFGGFFTAPVSGGIGVKGQATGVDGMGVWGLANNTGGYGVFGNSDYGNGIGVYARGTGTSGKGLYAWGTIYAGDFSGNVNVAGTITKSGGGFLIDHPTDPENKHLYHCFVESPEMLNTYRSRVTLDDMGSAKVALPSYFASACENPDYQLTPMGGAMPDLHVASEGPGEFVISGGLPGKTVCWTVVAARADVWAKANHPGVEIEKSPEKKGFYRHPELYGKDHSANENDIIRASKKAEKE